MDEREQQLLNFAAAEGMFNERLSTLGNLVKSLDADIYQAAVLRYVFDGGGLHRDVELVAARMADNPWIRSGEKSIRRALAFWEQAGIIRIERDRVDAAGRQLPNSGRLCWSSVLQQLLGGGRSAVPPSIIQQQLAVSLTDQRDGLTDQGDGLTDQGDGLTDQGDGLTDQGDGLLDQASGPTDHHPPTVRAVLYACSRAHAVFCLCLCL